MCVTRFEIDRRTENKEPFSLLPISFFAYLLVNFFNLLRVCVKLLVQETKGKNIIVIPYLKEFFQYSAVRKCRKKEKRNI